MPTQLTILYTGCCRATALSYKSHPHRTTVTAPAQMFPTQNTGREHTAHHVLIIGFTFCKSLQLLPASVVGASQACCHCCLPDTRLPCSSHHHFSNSIFEGERPNQLRRGYSDARPLSVSLFAANALKLPTLFAPSARV